MSSGNRTVKYENLLKSLRKHYKPLADPPERSVLEHLLYACCLEDARIDQADEGFAKLQQTYFDWNEVRVTTVAELAEALKPLPFPLQAASRIKQCLQSIFETRYQYDIDDMKKANLGKATAELEAWKGMSPFVVSYVSQHALGGHSIPASNLICDAMWQCDILTLAESQKNSLPGIERAIPKNKGVEFAALMHQFACDLYHHPRSATPLAVLKEMGATYKTKPKPEEQAGDSKSKGSKVSSAKPVPAKPAGTQVPEVKKSEPLASASKASPEQPEVPAAKGSVAKPTASKAPATKETVSKDTKSPNKATPKSVDTKVEAKPHSSKADASKTDKNTKPKIDASKTSKNISEKSKTDKGKPEKGKLDKGSQDKAKQTKAKPTEGKVQPSKAEKGKSEKSKPEKGKLEKPNSGKSKVDKSKPIKKESKDSGKSNKSPAKANHSSVGTNLTKKKPR
ncbi:MAG: hypothetical protein ACK6DQ_13120 [Planctomycetota bacterium]